ncbi:50S ribosomal protein L24 [Candidatus Woesearchaeota archaeon]|jgi:large subunit ribosomal protein L24|nr:50S ribosomal protein L24 [Candidatus Woesearchaeota archaeon]MBT4835209.1 50S ribosomal protein L24 [Candidatus Woesearchaeota archaeon]MBT6734916.1 50S ribosomal protein L24 [Candidatus Woesearchaeota archaeon]MBT7169569.1 50S ribosomal protein L24 [Candidatus Woesearchaeota archaeon]MBT7474527.1 50S ribosomal protein L24 [Candidatus Woesearchaeota archaeon]
MRSIFSLAWIRSKQPRKQRKYRHNAPLHIKKKFLSVNFTKELREKYNKRNLTVIKGDKVKIMSGQFKGKEGLVEKVDVRNIKILVQGAEMIKKDGSKVNYPISPSNLMITELKLDDKKRKASLERK